MIPPCKWRRREGRGAAAASWEWRSHLISSTARPDSVFFLRRFIDAHRCWPLLPPEVSNERAAGRMTLPLIVWLAAATACDTSPPNQALVPFVPAPSMSAYVTSPVLERLDASGNFVLDAAHEHASITAERATELSLAWIREFGPYIQDMLERQHGAPIKIGRLAPFRVVAAHSPYLPVRSDLPAPVRNLFGPYYLVELAADNRVAVTVAVSGLADEYRIASGKLVIPPLYGNDFYAVGVPQEESCHRFSPEAAVQSVAMQTGARAASEPTFVTRGHKWYPHYGFWRVDLDRRVPVQMGPGLELVNTTELLISCDGLAVAARPERSFSHGYRIDEPRTISVVPLHTVRPAVVARQKVGAQ